MNCDQIWNNYSKKIGSLVSFERNIQSNYEKQIKNTYELRKYYEENNLLESLPVSAQNMSFIDPISKRRFFYNFESISADEMSMRLKLQRNRELQFLLMEAYEIFEDTIEEIYALIGLHNINFWTYKEYANLTEEDVYKRNFTTLLNLASQVKGGAICIAKRLIRYFNINVGIDGISFIQHIVFIEKLRHIVVHRRGRITDLKKFIEKVANDSGTYNGGKISSKLVEFIGFYVATKDLDNLIVLEPHYHPNPFPIRISHNRFEGLIESLMACIYLLIQSTNKYIISYNHQHLPALYDKNISNMLPSNDKCVGHNQ